MNTKPTPYPPQRAPRRVAAAGGLLLPRWSKENCRRRTATSCAWVTTSPTPPIACCCRGSRWRGSTVPGTSRHSPPSSSATRTTPNIPCPAKPTASRKRRIRRLALSVEGLVARPGTYSLADLKRFPSRTQVTRHTCEEGWSAIGEWTGVQLGRVLEAAGMLPEARFVTLHCNDDYVDSIDLLDALHPQTLLAYGMNGRDLSVPHGAPVRLRVETQMGYKSMKYLERIVVTSELDDGGEEGNIQNGWSWYAGI